MALFYIILWKVIWYLKQKVACRFVLDVQFQPQNHVLILSCDFSQITEVVGPLCQIKLALPMACNSFFFFFWTDGLRMNFINGCQSISGPSFCSLGSTVVSTLAPKSAQKTAACALYICLQRACNLIVHCRRRLWKQLWCHFYETLC